MTTEHEDDEPAIEPAVEPAVEATSASITTQPDDGETEIATPAVAAAADPAADSDINSGDDVVSGDRVVSADATSTAEFPAPAAAVAATLDPAQDHEHPTDWSSQDASSQDGSSWTHRRRAVVAAVAVGAFAFGGVIGAVIGRNTSDHDGGSRTEYGDEHADGDARNADGHNADGRDADGRDAGSGQTDSRDAESRDSQTGARRGGGDRGHQQDGPTPNLGGAGGDQHGHPGRSGSGSGHGDP